jgi:predicted nucleotidyltransferase
MKKKVSRQKNICLNLRLDAHTRGLLSAAGNTIRTLHPLAQVLLYGSAAKGKWRPGSDFDLLVLTDRPLTTRQEDAVIDALYEIELDYGAVISTIIYPKSVWNALPLRAMPFHRNVVRDGIPL